MNVIDIKKRFKVFEKHPNLVFLDTAASALKLDSVSEKLNHYYNYLGSNVHRGAYYLAVESTRLFEETRKMVASFINSNIKEVVFTRGTTTSLNTVAYGYMDYINEGDEIITSELEHHSSILPWMNVCKRKNAKLKYIPLNENGQITVKNFKKVLTNKTKVVAITLASNVLGYVTPAKEIIKLAHEKGAIVILDAAQAAPHFKIDVKDLDVDFLAFSAHKMYGPTGVGILYGKYELLEKLNPFEYGGEMTEEVFIDHATWKNPPHKFEAGTPVIGEAIAFSEAIKFILELGFNEIHEYTNSLKELAVSELKKLDDIILYNEVAELPIVTFNFKNIHPHDASTFLSAKNIGVRSGQHCAQLVSKWLKVPATVRASFNIYNTKDDVNKFIEAVKETINYFKEFE